MANISRNRELERPLTLRQAVTVGALLDAMPYPALVFDLGLNILEQNAAHEAMTATERRDVTGRYMFDVFPINPDSGESDSETIIRRDVEAVVSKAQPGEPIRLRHDLQSADGRYVTRHWEVVHSPVIVGADTICILQTSRDITEAVLRHEFLLARETASENAAAVTYFSYDPMSDVFERSPAVDELFGYENREVGQLAAPFFQRIIPDDLPNVNDEIERLMHAPPRTLGRFDYRILIPETGDIRYVRARGEMVIDPDDQRRKLVGVFMDMTDKEITRTALEAAVADKERLLVEMNHRVENSLQMVMSMLRLKASRSPEPEVSETLNRAIMRVQAIAEVHGALYRGGDVTRVEIGSLLSGLAEAFQRSLGRDGQTIIFEGRHGPVRLSAERAIALGLIVSELMTNAAKYAPRGPDTAVRIDCVCEGAGATLIVENPVDTEGSGHAERLSGGIGMKLVNGFIKQLQGQFRTENADGRYRAVVDFPLLD